MSAKQAYLFDTNIIAGRMFAVVESLPKGQFFSCVVYTELITAADEKESRAYTATWKRAIRESRIVEPNRDDWLQSARTLHRLAQGRKQDAGGRSPARSSQAKQELFADVLIAVSARRQGVAVVTDDRDFQAIKRFVKGLRVISPAEFFG